MRKVPTGRSLLATVIEDRSARAQAGVAFLSYLGVSIVLYGLPVLTHLSGRFVGEGSGDARLYVWDLAWWPHAIASGLNPFHPTVVWAPTGANMAWITGLPGPALVMAPITAVFGGVVASNLLAIAAPALNGWAAFLLCRELTDRFWPSLAGAYLFLASDASAFVTGTVITVDGGYLLV